jgi:hypothetical protein
LFCEHYQDCTHGHTKSKFAEHLQHDHSIGPIDTVMEPMYFTTKGRLMNSIEKFHIYQETKQSNQINDKHTVQPNAISETLVHINSDRGHQPPPHTRPHQHSTFPSSLPLSTGQKRLTDTAPGSPNKHFLSK